MQTDPVWFDVLVKHDHSMIDALMASYLSLTWSNSMKEEKRGW